MLVHLLRSSLRKFPLFTLSLQLWTFLNNILQAKESNRKMLESLPSTSYPLKPTGHEAEVPQGYQSNTGKPLEQR